MKMKLEGGTFSAKKSTILYIIIAVIIVVSVIVVVLLNKSKKQATSSLTKGYNEVYEISDYAVKINSAAYFEDKKELAFVYYIKKIHNSTSNATVPAVSKIEVSYTDEDKNNSTLTFSSSAVNDIQSIYTAGEYTPDGVKSVTIYIEYTDADYKDKDKVDEFGDVTEGQWHKGESHTFYVIIDAKDIKKMKSDEFKAPELNTEEMDKGTSVTTSAPTEDSSEAENTSKKTSKETSKTTSKATTKTTTTRKTAKAPDDGDTGLPPDATTTTRRTAKAPDDGDTGLPPDATTTTRRTAKAPDDGDTGLPPDATTTTRRTAKTPDDGDTGLPPEDTTTTTKRKSSNTINSLSVDKTVERISIGDTVKISPIFSPSGSKTSFSWRSNREDRVTVDQNGVATAVDKGGAIITVTDNVSGLTASCMIVVEQ